MSDVIYVSQNQAPALPRGRLAFGVDATGSREASWSLARELQADMFRKAAPVGKLDVQLICYGGASCRATPWVSSGDELARLMGTIVCDAGETQIGRIFDHVLAEHAKAPIQALTFIGDACEETFDVLAGKALELGAAGVPIFMFQEGRDSAVRNIFRMLALKSGGAYFEFDPTKPRAAEQLGSQLNAIARMAVGELRR